MANKNGSKSIFRFEDNEIYSMKDLLYVNSQGKAIERLYFFLQSFYSWTLNKNHKKTLKEVVKDGKIDNHIISILKKYNYIDSDNNWLQKTQPSKADAVFIRLKLRDKNK